MAAILNRWNIFIIFLAEKQGLVTSINGKINFKAKRFLEGLGTYPLPFPKWEDFSSGHLR